MRKAVPGVWGAGSNSWQPQTFNHLERDLATVVREIAFICYLVAQADCRCLQRWEQAPAECELSAKRRLEALFGSSLSPDWRTKPPWLEFPWRTWSNFPSWRKLLSKTSCASEGWGQSRYRKDWRHVPKDRGSLRRWSPKYSVRSYFWTVHGRR